MKILNINKFFYVKGGTETYYFSLKDLLINNGHDVIDFSMNHEQNFESSYKEYFINKIDYNSFNSLYNKIKLSSKIIYSFESKNKIGALIKAYKPDIAHLHIFQHQLSPSILHELKKNNIPIVYTVHDLKSMCPNYKMLCNGKICEKCKCFKYFNCLKNKCVKDSYLKSLVSTVEMYIHHLMKVYDLIDVFLPPSRFFRDKLIEYGFCPDKIIYNPNFLDAESYHPNYNHKKYFIFLGRLSEEKGIFTLINAMQYVDDSADLWIIGTGPMENKVNEFIIKNKLERKIKLLGFKSGIELSNLVKNAMFGIIPSECYENAPYSALEMMAYGKPILGAKTGGIPELIDDEKTGLLFETGDANDLACKINKLLNNNDTIMHYGENARTKLEVEFNASGHYQRLYDIYINIIR